MISHTSHFAKIVMEYHTSCIVDYKDFFRTYEWHLCTKIAYQENNKLLSTCFIGNIQYW